MSKTLRSQKLNLPYAENHASARKNNSYFSRDIIKDCLAISLVELTKQAEPDLVE